MPETPATAPADTATCAVSGRTLPKAEMIAFGEDWVTPESRDVYLLRLQQGAGPTRTGERAPSPDQFTAAPAVRRFLAFFLDGLARGFVTNLIHKYVFPNATAASLLGTAAVIFTLVNLLYEGVPTAIWGGSPGKLLLRLQVVSRSGKRLTLGTALFRAVLKAPPVVGLKLNLAWTLANLLVACFNGPWRRSIHDMACRSTVVIHPV